MASPSLLRWSKLNSIIIWVVRIFLGLAFLGAACAKLAGVVMMVDVFEKIGLGQWFRYVTALVEIVGAIGLFIPGRMVIAALILSLTMFFAIIAHLFVLHTSPIGAAVLLILCITLIVISRHWVTMGGSNY